MESQERTQKQGFPFFPPFAAVQDFFSQPQQAAALWREMGRAQLDRVEQLFADVDELTNQGRSRMEEAGQELADLFKSSLQHGTSMAQAMRTICLQTARQSLDFMAESDASASSSAKTATKSSTKSSAKA